MGVLARALATLRGLLRRNTTADEIRDELRFHVDMRADEYRRLGLDPTRARQAALRRFGNLAVIKDRGYAIRGGGLLDTTAADVRQALRQLGREPGFSALVILTLAIAIGMSAALFSAIDAALLRPLPYPHPEQLVSVDVEEARGNRLARIAPSITDIRTWRAHGAVVSQAGMGRVNVARVQVVDTGTLVERLQVGEASEGFLETYGVTPILGRAIRAEDTEPGAPLVLLLGHAYWQSRFGGDPGVLGRVLRVESTPATIIGVLPAGFYAETGVWRAMQFSAAWLDRRGNGASVVARLRPGTTTAGAGDAMARLLGPAASGASHPRVLLESTYEHVTRQYRATLLTLSLAVGLILLMACVNVAGLLLARGARRNMELAIRASIGAGRRRLIRQLLTESLVLASMGAALGVLLARASLSSLLALLPLSLPPNSPVAIDATALAFALALTVATALLFGLVPALKLSTAARRLGALLASSGGGSAPSPKRAGQWLIGIEVAMAVVLVSTSALMLLSFARLTSVDLGFSGGNVLTFDVEPLDEDPTVRREYYTSLADTLRHNPDVLAAGAIEHYALAGGATYYRVATDTGDRFAGPQRTVLPGYLEAVGAHLLAGRFPQDEDRATGQAVVVDDITSDRYFRGQAVGHTLAMGSPPVRQLAVVGVVQALRHGRPDSPQEPQMYMLPDPTDTYPPVARMAMVIRLRRGATASLEQLKQAAESIGPRVLVGRAAPATDSIARIVRRPWQRTVLLTTLGALGLLLTLVGIFSTTAYAVTRRTREVGVRVACGARPVQVIGTIVRDLGWPVGLGIAAGLAMTLCVTRVIASFLFETTPQDPAALAASVGVLCVTAGAAAWLAARRAATLDPITALRVD